MSGLVFMCRNNIYKTIKNHSHTIITAVLVTVGCVLGYEIETLLVVGGFWLGREHSQAEYRFMKIQKITREDLGFLQGFNPISWNKDSLLNDLIIPIIIGILVILIYKVI